MLMSAMKNTGRWQRTIAYNLKEFVMKRDLPPSLRLAQRNIQIKQAEKNLLFTKLRKSPFIPPQFDNERNDPDPLNGQDIQ